METEKRKVELLVKIVSPHGDIPRGSIYEYAGNGMWQFHLKSGNLCSTVFEDQVKKFPAKFRFIN